MSTNWRETILVGCCVLLVQFYVFSPPIVEGQYGTQIECLNATCRAKLSALLDRYEYAVDSVQGCDVDCQYNCYELLEDALKSTDGMHCPPVDNVTACFGLYGNEWVELAEECPLFQIKEQSEAEAESEEAEAPSEEEAESEAESEEAEAPSEEEAESEAESEEAEAEAPSPEEAESGEATARRLMQGEGQESSSEEGEAPSSEEQAESEAEAEAPSSEEKAESEAEAEAEAEATGEEAEAEGECSSSGGGEGEGEGEGGESDFVGKGCFPDFETLTDFQIYTEGAYYAAVWNSPTNTVGIILSVFFWLGLAGMGVYLGRK